MTNEQLQGRCVYFAFGNLLSPVICVDGEILPVPNFLTSVDAHIKWTFPQIAKVSSYFEVYYDLEQEPNYYTCVIYLDKGSDRYAHEATPALAICKQFGN